MPKIPVQDLPLKSVGLLHAVMQEVHIDPKEKPQEYVLVLHAKHIAQLAEEIVFLESHIAVNEGSYSTPYVIDTQTGRVWRQAVDSENKMFVFVSISYRNIDGELSKVPNETATGIVLEDKRLQDVEQKLNADMNKLFPNSKQGGNTNSP